MAINNTYQNNNAAIQTFSTTPTVTTQYFQQQPTLSNLATSAQSMPQTQHVAPMIQNTNQVPLLHPQVVYTPMQPQIADKSNK